MAVIKRKISWTEKAINEKIDIMEYWYAKTSSTRYSQKLETLLYRSTQLLRRQPELGNLFNKDRSIRMSLLIIIGCFIPTMICI